MTDEADALVQDDEDQAEPEPGTQIDWEARYRKAVKETQGLRQRLRRSELSAEYGDLVELLPDQMPITEWEGWLGKAKEKLQPPATTQATPATEEAPSEEPTPQEVNLAKAATQSSPASAVVPGSDMSAKELGDLAMRDPAAFRQAIAAKYGSG